MGRLAHTLTLAILSIALAGCAPPIREQQPHAYAGPHLPEAQLAIIYGNNGGGGDRVNLNILAVDDVNTRVHGRGARKAFVTPSTHAVRVGALNGNYFSANLTISETFKAGHIYQLRHALDAPTKEGKGIHLWFEDMGSSYVPSPEIFPTQ